jgi:hypothetical protein
MRACLFVSISVASAVTLMFACGGSPPEGAKSPAGSPSAAPNAAAAPTGSNAPGSSTAPTAAPGPTTTTLALPDGGELQGAKLASSSSTTIALKGNGAATPGPHEQEPGRAVKDIQVIVQSRRDEARACYDAALANHPGIEGDIDIAWTIDPKGNVTDAHVDSSRTQILEPSVGTCISSIISRIRFAESAKGFETHAHYPFNFHPHTRRNAPSTN